MLWTYLALSVANVVGHLADLGWLVTATKPLLMPVLAAWLVTTAPRTRLTRLATVALGLSWLGDLALMGDGEGWFLTGLGGFALAQIVYLVAFVPLARTGLPRRRPLVLVPYGLVWLALMPFLAPRVGELLVPVAVYGLLLVAMAALAVGVHPMAAVGAALFVVSDALIALTSLAELTLPASGALVMATYTAAQGLIALGVSRRAAAGADTPAAPTAAPSGPTG